MVISENTQSTLAVSLPELVREQPSYIEYVLEAFGLLLHQNEELKKIASRYSHDLRSPVTNINMLLQLYDKADNDGDRRLYVHKISSSLERLQDGFEQLSTDRKNSLRRSLVVSYINLDKLAAEIKEDLPSTIRITTDFDVSNEALGIARYLYNTLMLLARLAEETLPDGYTVQLSTAKTWEGTQLIVRYPEHFDLKTAAQFEPTDTKDKNATKMTLMGWNYYFALLFLGAMGAIARIEENGQSNTEVVVTFTQ